MLRRLFCFLSIVFVYSMFCSSANCDDRSVQDQPQLFTNEDIERYQTPSDTKTVLLSSQLLRRTESEQEG